MCRYFRKLVYLDSKNDDGDRIRASFGVGGLAVVAFGIESSSVLAWSGLEVGAVAAIAVVSAVLAGWWTWRVVDDGGENQERPSTSSEPADAESSQDSSREVPAAQTYDSGLNRLPEARAGADVEDAFLTSDDEMPARRCPECDRRFPGVFDVCPFDSTALHRGEAGSTEGAAKRLPRRYCPDCQRRYELGATHCYHDGQTLRRDTDRASMGADTFWVCRDCGFETRDAGVEVCPRGGDPLTRLDPERRRQVKPAFPYNRCRQCGHIAAPDQTRCPEDGTLLLPELSANMTALPPTGHGDRRSVCPECGISFAGHCDYCSRDGTELIALN